MGKENVVSKVENFSKGYGVDAVIILASTDSNQPIELAAEIARERAKIVVPGMVKLDLPRKIFYLGDSPPVDLYEFANEIQTVLGVRKIRNFPLWPVKLAAKSGDILKAMGCKKFPLTSFRLNNIRTEYMFDLQPIMDIAAPLPYDFKTSIKRRTVQWMRETGEI